MKRHQKLAISIFIIFLSLFAALFFAYFFPVQFQHARIAKLPSHDLTLFQDEEGRTIYNGDTGGVITYDGEVVSSKDDFIRIFNNDKVTSWLGGYIYFYDAEKNLFLALSTTSYMSSASVSSRPMFLIREYKSDYKLPLDSPPPFIRAAGLGPFMFLRNEMTGGDISSSRYSFVYSLASHQGYPKISTLNASLQIALAFAPYFIPLVCCVIYRRKKTIFISAGCYVLLFVLNIAYYMVSYPWLRW